MKNINPLSDMESKVNITSLFRFYEISNHFQTDNQTNFLLAIFKNKLVAFDIFNTDLLIRNNSIVLICELRDENLHKNLEIMQLGCNQNLKSIKNVIKIY